MGRGVTERYVYWSGRRVDQIASDNGVDLRGARHWVVKTPTIGVLPQVEIGNVEGRTVTRAEVARRIEKKLGATVTTDFDAAAVGTVRFASGLGTIEAAEFVGSYARNKATILHAQVRTASGARVDVCLFGSMENLVGFQQADAVPVGWSSSAWSAIEELLRTKGRENSSSGTTSSPARSRH